ncbi:MAG TPA: cation diffusion facilitator family transporter [Dehalococcoidales bacterium]|nr:cation diffusion facilitator family transporter [Dehalococcoidales bacterium]
MFSSRVGAARLALAVVIGLILLKVAVSVITGSISILAQAVDSFLDLFAVVISLFAVRIALKPADVEHPFGHGKAENIAAIVQAMLIFTAGCLIIYSAVRRIMTGATVELTEAGIGVMLVSVIASIFLSRHLLKVARATDSIALQANARNIAADVYSAAAVLAGLVIIRITGLDILDPIIALLVALFILKVAYDVLRGSFGGLIDVRLSPDEEGIIELAIMEHKGEIVGFHQLRTRKAGNQRYIDLHLVMPRSLNIDEAHQFCDHLEQDIASKLRQANVTIHVEPCGEECEQCPIYPHRGKEKS